MNVSYFFYTPCTYRYILDFPCFLFTLVNISWRKMRTWIYGCRHYDIISRFLHATTRTAATSTVPLSWQRHYYPMTSFGWILSVRFDVWGVAHYGFPIDSQGLCIHTVNTVLLINDFPAAVVSRRQVENSPDIKKKRVKFWINYEMHANNRP